MLTNRRKTVLGILGASGAIIASASLGKSLPSGQPKSSPSSGAEPGASDSNAVEKALREDLARLKSRAYSDEGVAVFLACEDLVAVKSGTPALSASKFSQRVAADLRKTGEAWQRLYANAPATDVSTVIEVLADRDFRRGGRGLKP